MAAFNFTHLKAMMHKDFLEMKAERKKTIAEVCFTVGYGCLLGYEVSVSFDN